MVPGWVLFLVPGWVLFLVPGWVPPPSSLGTPPSPLPTTPVVRMPGPRHSAGKQGVGLRKHEK